ncbi:amidase [Fusarium albosuccineum]|uniref:Amidase n=1 Tax=Fusarium albosuccineum TaxID=1237068 RepID=A0A8H4LCT7_9HYPO|nr:amidase [Fusarium albosuccineum]
MAPPSSFADYPQPIEGPDVKYVPKIENNPVFRGLPLVIGANIISKVGFLQQHFWDNAGFGTIREIPELADVPFRFHPSVTPLGPTEPTIEFGPDLLKAKYADSKARYYTANDYHEMYKSGQVTPLQVAEALLPLITKPSGKYSDGWIDFRDKDNLVLEAARESTERYAAGQPLSVLDGVPVGIKDDTSVKGYRNHNGMKYNPTSPFFNEKTESSWPVKKLQEAGAVVLGKNCMHELGSAMIDTSGCNVTQGTPTNWHNKSYYPGGSSSGGASTLSVGIVPIVVGTDAGGSARIPAAFNSVFGLKTTHHRTVFMNNTMAVTSPLAATAADLTIAYRVMSQPNPDCHIQGRFALSVPPAEGSNKVIGIYRDWWNQADQRVKDVCERAVDYFANKCGYDIIDISIPYIPEAHVTHSVVCITEMAEDARRRTPNPADWLSLVGSPNKVIMSIGAKTPAGDLLKYNSLRELIMRHLAFLFQKHPGLLILTPTTPMVGWPIVPGDEKYGMSDTNKTMRNMLYIFLANMTGTPALSAPVGYIDPEQGEGQLPVGLLATGEWGSEEQLLAWAAEAEDYLHHATETSRRRPSEWLDVMGLVKKADA